MRFASGHQRFVILTKMKAIKIAKIHIFSLFLLAIKRLPSVRRTAEYFAQHKGRAVRHAGSKILEGWISNRNEYRCWKATQNERLVPVLKRLLFGFVIIQYRGEAVSAEELRRHSPLDPEFDTEATDTGRPEQFCKIRGEIKLADYGHPEAYERLMQASGLAA